MFAYTKIMQAMSGAVAVVTDAYFNLVTLLLNTTATNGAQNNTFLDSSTNNLTITRNGNTTQGTYTPFSQTGWSNYFDGTAGQYLNTPSNAAFAFGTGDFTVEAWVFVTGTSFCEIFITTNTTPTSTSMRFIVTNAQKLEYSDQTNTATSTGTIPLNTWTNVAVSRSGTSVKLFINGTQDGSTTSSNNLTNQVGYIGRTWDGFIFTGYISNLRVTKGGALYTSNFTPSTVPLTTTVSSGTVSLLTCQSNRFLDNSTNAFTITVNGTPSVQAFSPFLPTTAYSTSVVGGSGYFDGTGDNLATGTAAALDFGTGNFTIECWYYLTSTTNGDQTIMSNGESGYNSSVKLFKLYYAGQSFPFFDFGSGNGSVAASNTSSLINQWNHVALVRSGNTFTMYLNGVGGSPATFTGSVNMNSSNNTYIGYFSFSDPNSRFTGYVSGLRAVTSAVYTANFSVPTAPPTAISGTQLLLNCTNAGIFDSAAKNDLETGGDAQVSTTVAKWGTTSMYFDGTGDYLVGGAFSSPIRAFNTGDFTIEGWFYTGANKTQIILDTGTTGGSGSGMQLALNSSGYPYFFIFNSTTITSSIIVSLGTWTHVAWVRNNGVADIYVNGVSGVSTANTSNLTDTGLTIGTPNDYRDTSSTFHYNGYIDDLRITRGYARYTANFTAPTAAFPLQ